MGIEDMAERRIHGTSNEPEITLQTVFEEVDRVDQKLDQVLNELAKITRKLEELASSLANVREYVDRQQAFEDQ